MKVLAFYLPQYHPIIENDNWWGEGFTEWTNVKKAYPLFDGHRQPRVPLNNNYYHLLDPDVQQWQADIAQQHGIDGFCYYHYWFNGRQLLEKPFEQVLSSKQPDFPFCLAWANEPWTRAWDGGNRKVLMPQTYGDVVDWEAHFQYLLKAFKDPRYIRHDDKPVFLIYRSASIPDCAEMLDYWRKRAQQEGLSGLHLVSMLTVFSRDSRSLDFDAYVEFEPMNTICHYLPLRLKAIRILRILFARFFRHFYPKANLVDDVLDYRLIWELILSRSQDINVYPGAFVDWDNSARRGFRATVMKHFNIESFEVSFSKQYIKSQSGGAPFLFINAWNEWAEGTYLEPDEFSGNSILEIIKQVVSTNKQYEY